ncbi:uncharacterized protein LOC143863472 [Tasmannia lanceolata]|uniref:uncharacterized protein LOC143863472 n=1 Tax=Tasmannia lanceolata TaxID=3420 RepID=UPI004063FCE2
MGSEGKRVVVVGGGIAGGLLVKSLQFFADVILIDPKEYFEIPWAQLRCMVEPSFAERSVVKHAEYLRNGRIIKSSAINVTDKEVLTADGHMFPYDYLVIATGHTDSVPQDRTQRLHQFQAENQKIKSAKSVLIVGGGPTGVELAGEIAVDYPDKKVTLVHKGPRLLEFLGNEEFLGNKASTKTLKWLTAKKVDVLLNQSVDLDSVSNEGGTYVTSAGKTIVADCIFGCVGRPLGSSWLEESVLKDCLDRNGRLMVDENLRVRGRKNVFAIGDVTNIPEIKQGFYAQKHALVAAKNIKLLIGGIKESKMKTDRAEKVMENMKQLINGKMKTYKAGKVLAIVSLGRKEALAQIPFTTMIGRIPGMIKSKDLFVGKTRKDMGIL